jgi:hypothetical protein
MARTSWLDEDTQEVKIDAYARQLGPFVDALADGRVDEAELQAQQQRVVRAMQEVEPRLDDALHAKVTALLCELSALNLMQTMHLLGGSRPRSTFRG